MSLNVMYSMGYPLLHYYLYLSKATFSLTSAFSLRYACGTPSKMLSDSFT